MIDWKLMSEEEPENGDAFYLVQERGGKVTSAYWCGREWHEPWGNEYLEEDQPLVWAEFNFPRILK